MLIVSTFFALVTTAHSLTDAQLHNRSDVPFDITATVVLRGTPGTRHFAVQDGTGIAYLSLRPGFPSETLALGMDVRVTGTTESDERGLAYAVCDRIDRFGMHDLPQPVDVTPSKLLDGQYLHKRVRVTATVSDIFFDEITPRWIYLDLADGSNHVTAALIVGGPAPILENLIGVRVILTGILLEPFHNDRTHLGSILTAHGIDSLVPLQDPLPDPFAVPAIPPTTGLRPDDFRTIGRVRDCGEVIAVWGQTHFLIRSSTGEIRRVDLLQPPAPTCGDGVDVVGAAETDLYHVNLSRALWRPAAVTNHNEAATSTISLRDIFADEQGDPCIRTTYHGQPIALVGIVRSLPAEGLSNSRLYLENDSYIMPIDVGACPQSIGGISVGSRIRVAGICVIDVPNWQPDRIVPRIEDVLLVVRTPHDITVLDTPSWWTPPRTFAALGAFTVILLWIAFWNLQLRRRSERRGRELARESVARIESDLKAIERTRLAVELHDSISQSLTGIAMEIEAALQFKERAHSELLRHLGIAWRTLRACRSELRNCLWDLRNHALEEANMDTAIRRCLLPHLASVRLIVRFAVPRNRFTDNTAYAILCIIRELTVNAIRHGKATEIKVAGLIEGDHLSFSVRDNGCGFDPSAAPGIAQGHFGLQGIQERIHRLHGDMAINSAPGRHTRVSVTIRLPHDDHEHTHAHEENLRTFD